MKKGFIILFMATFAFAAVVAQNVGIGTASPNTSAQLDVNSSTRGLLIPRNTYSGIVAIANPAKGLLVLDTFYNQLMMNMGTPSTPMWRTIVYSSGWNLSGNTNIDPGTQFIGTTDNNPLNFRVSNQPAGQIHYSSGNVFLGYSAGRSNLSGIGNTAMGTNSLMSMVGGGFFPSQYNTAIGFNALTATLYYNNTGVGYSALSANTSGVNNTAVGAGALVNNVGGSNNVAIGAGAGTDQYGSYNNTISVGNAGWLNGADNQVFLGNASTSWIGGYKAWSVYSDARLKTDIREDVKGLDFIMRLRPVSYRQNVDDMARVTGNKPMDEFPGKHNIDKMRQNGFLAQEVEKAANDAGYSFSGISKVKSVNELYSLSYESFVVPLVKAIQEQQSVIDALLKRIDKLESALANKNQ